MRGTDEWNAWNEYFYFSLVTQIPTRRQTRWRRSFSKRTGDDINNYDDDDDDDDDLFITGENTRRGWRHVWNSPGSIVTSEGPVSEWSGLITWPESGLSFVNQNFSITFNLSKVLSKSLINMILCYHLIIYVHPVFDIFHKTNKLLKRRVNVNKSISIFKNELLQITKDW